MDNVVIKEILEKLKALRPEDVYTEECKEKLCYMIEELDKRILRKLYDSYGEKDVLGYNEEYSWVRNKERYKHMIESSIDVAIAVLELAEGCKKAMDNPKTQWGENYTTEDGHNYKKKKVINV